VSWSTSNRRGELPADWPRIRLAVKRRARGRCQATTHVPECNGVGRDCDHIGNPDDHRLSNLQWLSHPCHQAKTISDRPVRARPTASHPGLLTDGA
jgi:hypothetical protein